MSSHGVLFRAISGLLAIGETATAMEREGDFHASVQLDGHRAGVSEVWASASLGCWEVWTPEYRERRVFNPIDGLLITEGRRREEYPNPPGRRHPVPAPAKFAFPLSLPIWGRSPIDEWSMSDAEESEAGTVVKLIGLRDRELTARLQLDVAGAPVSLETPGGHLAILTKEPLMDLSRFWWRQPAK